MEAHNIRHIQHHLQVVECKSSSKQFYNHKMARSTTRKEQHNGRSHKQIQVTHILLPILVQRILLQVRGLGRKSGCRFRSLLLLVQEPWRPWCDLADLPISRSRQPRIFALAIPCFPRQPFVDAQISQVYSEFSIINHHSPSLTIIHHH